MVVLTDSHFFFLSAILPARRVGHQQGLSQGRADRQEEPEEEEVTEVLEDLPFNKNLLRS